MPLTRAQKAQQSAFGLLALPEPLLLAVLKCLAAPADQRSLFSAAQAHSRLHRAAVTALSSIAATGIRRQRTVRDALSYLRKHKQHVRSLSLAAAVGGLALQKLPRTLQLHSLQLDGLNVQLLPGNGHQGVLGYDGVSALTQLRLTSCTLLDDDADQVAAALAQLPPGLQHLALDYVEFTDWYRSPVTCPIRALQHMLQQLTHLELLGVLFEGQEDQASPTQQLPQALSRLVDLRLSFAEGFAKGDLPAGLLSGATGLTRLELVRLELQPGELAGKTQLQHLLLFSCETADAGWTPQLLLQLASMQQLTHLQLSFCAFPDDGTPATAVSALTASSSLQRLWLHNCSLPAGMWQHVFPAGRQLPHLTSLEACVDESIDDISAVPDARCVVCCCPGLRSLDVQGLVSSPGAFAPLQGLTGLHTLVAWAETSEVLEEVCQLTGLRELQLDAFGLPLTVRRLLQMMQLRQLTALTYSGLHDDGMSGCVKLRQAPGDEPVWRQVLQHHLDHSDPAVAQAAAAALEAE